MKILPKLRRFRIGRIVKNEIGREGKGREGKGREGTGREGGKGREGRDRKGGERKGKGGKPKRSPNSIRPDRRQKTLGPCAEEATEGGKATELPDSRSHRKM